MTSAFAPMPNTEGYFGPYGGQLVPPHLKQAMDDINTAYAEITKRQDFQQELAQLFADYVGRPSPIDRKSTRLNSSHLVISYAVFCLKQKSDTPSSPPVGPPTQPLLVTLTNFTSSSLR